MRRNEEEEDNNNEEEEKEVDLSGTLGDGTVDDFLNN